MTSHSQATRTIHFKRVFEKRNSEINNYAECEQMCSPYSLLRTCDRKKRSRKYPHYGNRFSVRHWLSLRMRISTEYVHMYDNVQVA